LELKHIKDLMAAMGKTGTKRLRLKKDDYELELEREEEIVEKVTPIVVGAAESVKTAEIYEPKSAKSKAPDIPASLHPPVDHAEEKQDDGTFVTSPMVGTFYAAAGPDEPAFINVGDKIAKDTVVCIVEAMKVMNEVKAGQEGVVSEILVENGHPVEFGTKLFKIS